MNANTNTPDLVCTFCHKTTLLRCCDCDRPLCIECAKMTPTGRICKDCIQKLQDVFYMRLYSSGKLYDYPIAFIVSFIMAIVLASLIALSIYTIISPKPRSGIEVEIGPGFIFIIATSASAWLANLIRKFVKRRRSRYLKHITIIGTMLGVISGALFVSWLLQLEAVVICVMAFLLGVPFYMAIFNETTLT